MTNKASAPSAAASALSAWLNFGCHSRSAVTTGSNTLNLKTRKFSIRASAGEFFVEAVSCL